MIFIFICYDMVLWHDEIQFQHFLIFFLHHINSHLDLWIYLFWAVFFVLFYLNISFGTKYVYYMHNLAHRTFGLHILTFFHLLYRFWKNSNKVSIIIETDVHLSQNLFRELISFNIIVKKLIKLSIHISKCIFG